MFSGNGTCNLAARHAQQRTCSAECARSAELLTQSASLTCTQIEHAEARWKGLKKKILNRREALAALQQAEAVDVRRKSDAFSERVEEYRK